MKKYNLSSKSDMKRFERDIRKKAESMAEEKIQSMSFEVECKNCHRKISARSGYNRCPICGNVFMLNNNITFSG